MKEKKSFRERSLQKPFTNLIIFLLILSTSVLMPFMANSQLSGTLCSKVIGEWQWDKYGTVYIFPDGTTEHVVGDEMRNTGKWLCDIDVLKVKWTKTGWEDRLKINNNGSSMKGKNQYDMQIVATKVGAGGFTSDCSLVTGNWQWGGYGQVNILSDNTTTHYDGGSLRNTGKWFCENGKMKIKWTNGGFTDRLWIKADGSALIGQNRQGMPIKATRM